MRSMVIDFLAPSHRRFPGYNVKQLMMPEKSTVRKTPLSTPTYNIDNVICDVNQEIENRTLPYIPPKFYAVPVMKSSFLLA
jgi:hypothetical protein